MKKFTQLDIKQRAKLQVLLKEKKSLSEVAKILDVSRQTVYREILRNSYQVKQDTYGCKGSCIHFLDCKKQLIVNSSTASVCHPNCFKYEPGRQSCLRKYPFVCNYCRKQKNCQFLHFIYDPDNASNEYHMRISNANAVPKTEVEKIKEINKIVSPLVKKGQSIEVILMNHPEIGVSALTIRNWIKLGYLDCKFSELRMFGRRVSKKYDYSKVSEHIKLSEDKVGHKYANYLYYKKLFPNSLTIQLDSVIGNIDGKHFVLTIHIVEYKFQFGILLNNKTKTEVFNALNNLLTSLKQLEDNTAIATYQTFANCWLTDNGTEFDDLLKLINIHPNLNIFFCHPNASFEKGACERNHVLVRYIQYKGWSFDNLNQSDINTLFSHINSYPRKSLNKKTPYQCILESPAFGKEFLDVIGIYKVNCDDVNLTPALLKKIKN